ncbi:hypothetical protein ACFXEL_07120 [Streptomyces sp. NPDC059382]|uniref:hypothetical protein n=1 Tax=Streptomyces sp. NPDC059382 TaxID=3346816 RepID=UPI0036B3BCCC
MVRDFDPATATAGAGVLPGPDEVAMGLYVRPRVLEGLPFWEACAFCTAGG